VPTSTGTPLPLNIPDLTVAKAATKCQTSVAKGALALVNASLKGRAACIAGLMKCVQTKPGDAACLTKASGKCDGYEAKLDAAAAKLGATLGSACAGSIDFVNHVRSASGLGYDVHAAACATAGTPLGSLGDVAACIVNQHECQSDQLLGAEAPRAGELLRVGGVGVVPCLVDRGGTGEGAGDPKLAGKPVDKCATAIVKAGSGYVGKKLKGLGTCVAKAFACVQTKPGDAACLAKVQATCNKELAKLGVERGKVAGAIDKACATLDFTGLVRAPFGVNLGALAGQTPGGVPFGNVDALGAYVEALQRQHDCLAEDLFRFAAPRAEQLLGLLPTPITLRSDFCPVQ
jgi:hypothetical protein